MKTITEEKGITAEYKVETREKTTITNVVTTENKATITRKKTSRNKQTSTKGIKGYFDSRNFILMIIRKQVGGKR